MHSCSKLCSTKVFEIAFCLSFPVKERLGKGREKATFEIRFGLSDPSRDIQTRTEFMRLSYSIPPYVVYFVCVKHVCGLL